MAKLSFNEALDRAQDGHAVRAREVQARALSRRIWIAEWHLPGCLSESQSYCLTKRDAIDAACSMADSPRGMRADLMRSGRSDKQPPDAYVRGAITTVYRVTLADLLA